MKKKKNVALLGWLTALALVFAVGCCSVSPLLQVAAIKKPVILIVERHDAYVEADASLSQEDASKYLSESAGLMALIESNMQVTQAEIKPLAVSVCARHDAYVKGDQNLDDLHRRTYLRSTALLIQVIDAGK